MHEVHSDQGVRVGQSDSEQLSVTFSSPTHPTILSLGKVHSRTLLLLPPPHVALHSVHSVQSVQTGQMLVAHSFDSSFSPWQPFTRSTDSTHSRART